MVEELSVSECETAEEDRETFAVMGQLREHLTADAYPALLRRLRAEGVRLVAARKGGRVVGCASFRHQHRLALCDIVYVDDLVTDAGERSGAVGQALLTWIEAEALKAGAAWCVLDSGVQRAAAHRFYFRQGYAITSFNFKKRLPQT